MFMKYPSLENHYQGKTISMWLQYNPILTETLFIATEKIHGANFSVEFTSDGDVFLSKRSGRIEEGESFYGVREVWAKIAGRFGWANDLAKITRDFTRAPASITLFGELFGSNIQKGVDYGPEKQIRFFDIAVNGKLCPVSSLCSILATYGCADLMVPIVGYATGIEAALALNENFDSMILGREGNPSEGLVIKPFHDSFEYDGSYFAIKKKAAAFLENKAQPRVVKQSKDISPEAAILRERFKDYVNENRLEGIFSKEGRIEDRGQIGQYIALLLEDARVDFEKENEGFSLLNPAEKKLVTSANKQAADLVKAAL